MGTDKNIKMEKYMFLKMIVKKETTTIKTLIPLVPLSLAFKFDGKAGRFG